MGCTPPLRFDDFSEVEAFRDKLLAEVAAGRMTEARYRIRMRQLVHAYQEQVRWDSYARQLRDNHAQGLRP